MKRRTQLGAGTGPKGTPSGSRAGSPTPPSRLQQASSAATPSGPPKPVTAQEIIDALPPLPNGITIGALLKMFDNRVDKEGTLTRKEWLQLVKENSVFSSADKLLRRKV